MRRTKARHVLKPKFDHMLMGISAAVLVVAAGSATVYQCSSTQVPLIPSDSVPQPQKGNPTGPPEPAGNPSPQPDTSPSQTPDRNDLSSMRTEDMILNGRTFTVWIAETDIQREHGLMNVQPSEVADNQGMLFAFPADSTGGFWMKDTLMPLDIAFIRNDGLIVDIQQMAPLTLDQHEPSVPYRYALEVNAGVLAGTGLQPGQTVVLPINVLNSPAS